MDAILGPSVPGLKGKTVRRNKPAVEPNIVPIPQHIRDHYQDVTLAIDIMHVNKIPFLMSISRSIHYGTASVLATMKLSNVLEVLQDLKKHYRQRDFNIRYILADGRFTSMRGTDFTPLPMPQDAIDRVAYMARNAPLGLKFTDYQDEAYATESDDDDAQDDTFPANITDHSDSDENSDIDSSNADSSSSKASDDASDSDEDSESSGDNDSDSDTNDDVDDPMGLDNGTEGVIDTPTEYGSDESEAMEDTIDTTGVDAEEAPSIGTT